VQAVAPFRALQPTAGNAIIIAKANAADFQRDRSGFQPKKKEEGNKLGKTDSTLSKVGEDSRI